MKTKPSDFCTFPWDSAIKKVEYEQIALNIMKILKRTGNKFRQLSFEEYKREREKDGDYGYQEEIIFQEVSKYCVSAETAKLFSPEWMD